MKAAAILVVLAALGLASANWAQLVAQQGAVLDGDHDEECRNMEPLGECTSDQGRPQPQHLQTVFLGSDKGPGWWLYPSADLWLKSAQHDIRTITDTKRRWAEWIWHDCGDGYVCLESGRYPNYYLYKTRTVFKTHKIAYSAAPESQDWTKFTIKHQWNDDRGLYMYLVRKMYETNAKPIGLPVHIYIPPRCEGYRIVVNHANKSPVNVRHHYTLQRGVVNTETISTTTGVGVGAGIGGVAGVVGGVLAAGFSKSWNQEKSTALSENQIQDVSTTIPPGKRLVKWQKVATYGPYEWRSGVEFITCLETI